MNHDSIERNSWLMVTLILIVISIGGLVEILPLIADSARIEADTAAEPYPALVLEGRDVYLREGCHVCHTQMVRALRTEIERYGPMSTASEHVYEHPFLWGSKRTGPDLARVGSRYSDAWHRAHLYNPRTVVPQSNMPAFPWLFDRVLDGASTGLKMERLRLVGVPYTDAQIAGAREAVAGVSEADALVAYLQQLGTPPRTATDLR